MSRPNLTVRGEPGSLESLIPGWRLSLRAANRAPKTIKSYLEAADQFLGFLDVHGMPTQIEAIRREHVEAFIVHLADTRSATTAATRYRALQQLFRWLVEEGEVQASPMVNMRPPTIEEAPVPVLSADDQRRLLAACAGKDFDARRDTALVLVLLDTGIRRAEAIGMELDDVDLDTGSILVHGKGSRDRVVSVGVKTAAALARYERARARHDGAAAPAYWLGLRGPLGDSGLAQILRRRSKVAGIPPVRAHQLRHSWAHAMLSLGHTEGTLRQLGGWRTRDMLDRYGSSLAAERARDAHRDRSPADAL
jgi:site-specific recombinase XerD